MNFNLRECKFIYNNKEIKIKSIDFDLNFFITKDFKKIPFDEVHILRYYNYGSKKIYHKDILNITFEDYYLDFKKGESIKGILEFYNNDWIFKTKKLNFRLREGLYCIQKIERLGNYYTDPELLV
jgi:hypothetical protein